MKKSIFTLVTLLSIISSSCGSSSDLENETIKIDSLYISGKATIEANEIKLFQIKNNKFEILDSSLVVNQNFEFKKQFVTPQVFYIVIDNNQQKTPVFVENSTITIDINGHSKDSITINNSTIHSEWEKFQSTYAKEDSLLISIVSDYQIAVKDDNTSLIDSLIAQYDLVDSLKKEKVKTFISSNPKSFISPYLITVFYMNSATLGELIEYNNNLDTTVNESIYKSIIEKRISQLESLEVGNILPEFSQTDTNGKMINLSDFKGQYVLIDFWASWCGPCRKENPNVVKAFNTYKSNNFTVLGVSLDNNKEAWLKAIETDGLTWSHVGDLNGWNNAVAEQFGIKSVPFSILIDPEGKILAKNLREEDLQEFLSELFSK